MVVNDDVSLNEFVDCFGGLGGDFVRVVEVSNDVKTAVFLRVFFEEGGERGII